MSNRLESLSGKPPGAKTSLKFKPKSNVARRSQEERARDAPAVKSEAPSRSHQPPRKPTRGRPGSRQPYAGTHLVSSGLLSTGSVSIGAQNTPPNVSFRTSGGSSSLPTPEFLQARASKLKKSTDSDGEDIDFSRIDMGSAYDFGDEDTLLFPVRAPRSNGEDPINVMSATPSAVPSVSPAPEVKMEVSDDQNVLSNIKSEDSTIEPRIVETQTSVLDGEGNRLDLDHDKIRALIEGKAQERGGQSNYFLMHMPSKLPIYEDVEALNDLEAEPEAESRAESNQSEAKAKPSEPSEHSEHSEPLNPSKPILLSLSAGPYPPQGQIGTINIHKSGKITVTLGDDIVMDVIGGSEATFLQEVALLNLNPEVTEEEMKEPTQNELLRLGKVEGKLVVVPSLIA